MTIWRTAFLAWLATGACVMAQMSRGGGPPSVGELYGAGPSSGPNMFNNKPPAVTKPAAANTTANATVAQDAPATELTAKPEAGNTTAPAPSTPVGVAFSSDLSTFPMPNSMADIDNARKLAPQDQFVYQVMEDHDAPRILFVYEDGGVEVPYLSARINASGSTLRTLAAQIKAKLEDPALNYYNTATVLLAPYRSDHSRGHVNVVGAVVKPGYVNIPSDNVLTLWQALQSAGMFTAAADREHVLLIHNDPDPAKPSTRQEINIQKFMDEGREPDIVIQPGDFINVQSKTETNSTIYVTGEVQRQQIIPYNSSSPQTILQVMLEAGFTEWSNHNVHIIRYKNGVRDEHTVDVDEIQLKGHKEKDEQLQPGDMVIVKKNWWNFS